LDCQSFEEINAYFKNTLGKANLFKHGKLIDGKVFD